MAGEVSFKTAPVVYNREKGSNVYNVGKKYETEGGRDRERERERGKERKEGERAKNGRSLWVEG